MSQPQFKVVDQLVTTADATAGVVVPTGETWRVTSVILQQATGSDAKIIQISSNGTTATASNVELSYSLSAGQQKVVDYPGLILAAGDQFHVVGGGTTNQCVVVINVLKDKVA